MDVLDKLGRESDTALVILSFLQADCKSAEYRDELLSLGQGVNPTRGFELHGCTDASVDDGYLETDDAAVIQQVAEDLKEIAAQLERRVVAEATQNLRRNLLTSTSDKWEDHLSREVSKVMRQNVTLKDVAQEHITVALTLTLVKGVCEQTPQLLRNLFTATLHYIVHFRAR